MSTFTKFNTSLKLEYDLEYSRVHGKDYWSVIDGFIFYSEKTKYATKVWIEVPDGFLSDGASVPKPLWNWLPPLGLYGQAAVLHDFLRHTLTVYLDGQINNREKQIFITIKESDQIFLEAMKVLGVSRFKRYTMYIFVRLFAIVKNVLKGISKCLK